MHSVPMRHIGYNSAFSKSPRLMLNNYFWNILTGQYISEFKAPMKFSINL